MDGNRLATAAVGPQDPLPEGMGARRIVNNFLVYSTSRCRVNPSTRVLSRWLRSRGLSKRGPLCHSRGSALLS